MPILESELLIAAPAARCFDLARSIDLHRVSAEGTSEDAIAGVTTGLIAHGEEVTWRARHLGLWWEMTVRITAFDRPRRFRDSMVRGPFARFDHDHVFTPRPDGSTHVRDVFDYTSPLGPLGRVADAVFLARHMDRFLRRRNAIVKAVAESERWREFLPG